MPFKRRPGHNGSPDRALLFLREHWLLLLILCATALLRLPSLFEPLWYGDEAVYLTVSRQMLRGDLLYVEVFDHKPPLLYYLTAGSLAVFGHSVAAIKLLAFVTSLATLVALYSLARRLMSKTGALIAVAVLSLLITPTWLEGNIAGSEIMMILPICAGMLLGLRGQHFLAGCFFGLGFLLKGPAIFDFGAFLVFATLSAEKGAQRQTLTDLGLLTGGFFAPFAVSALFFAAQGGLDEYFEAAFLTGVDYTSDGGDGGGNFLSSHSRQILNALPVLLLVAVLAAATLYRRRSGRGDAPGGFALILLWLAFSFYGVLFGGRPYEHYLVQAAPPFSLLCAFALAHTDPRRLVAAGALLIVLGVTVDEGFDVGHRRNLYYYRDYARNFIEYALGEKGFEAYADHFDGRTARNYRIASLLKAEADGGGERLYLFSDQPAIYFRSGLDPAVRFVFFHHTGWKEAWIRETARGFAEDPPEYIVTEEPPLGEFTDLEESVRGLYELIASDGILRVYKRPE